MIAVPEIGRRLARGALDLLYPPICLACGALGEPFCDACRAGIRSPGTGVPPLRGLQDLRSAGFHDGPLREAVLRLKFARKVALAEPLAALLEAELRPLLLSWHPDCLAPVPIHWTRRVQRGFNQSELLAEALSRRTGLPLRAALLKVRRTLPQVGLSAAERARNLRGALAVDPGLSIRGARIVLIDDVTTTGATLAECAAALRRAGAAAVFGLTVTWDG